ncbi:hypothetical protein BJV77DRAFT_1013596 [Russula vinacea]|nr:hypothetical protein BJV77DRAFT_1013596 [Russula vinacea]
MPGRQLFQILPAAGVFGPRWPRGDWLPHLLKQEYVTLLFISQASCEKGAQPARLAHARRPHPVLMPFYGIRPDDVGVWVPAPAWATAEDGATFCVKDVGVDAVRTSEGTLFRVLE